MTTTGRLPKKQFEKLMLVAPIPCVDIIVVRQRSTRYRQILMGQRQIIPLKKQWALIGCRIFKNEEPEKTCERQLRAIGIKAKHRAIVGAFSTQFRSHPQKRHDITLCYVYEWISGEPNDPTGELYYFSWLSADELRRMRIPKHYMRMIKAAGII